MFFHMLFLVSLGVWLGSVSALPPNGNNRQAAFGASPLQSFCQSSSEHARKVALVSPDILLLTNNSEYFDVVRTFRLASGASSSGGNLLSKSVVNVSALIQPESDRTASSLVWFLTYDVITDHCLVSNRQSSKKDTAIGDADEDQSILGDDEEVVNQVSWNTNAYCSRLAALKNIVIAREHGTDQKLVFLKRSRRGGGDGASPSRPQFSLAHDSSNFLEFKVLVKQLDSYGYISSLTFEQFSDQFVSTHFGRKNQICLTHAKHGGSGGKSE